MTKPRFFAVLAAVLALLMGSPVRADKLDDLGLDRDGKPKAVAPAAADGLRDRLNFYFRGADGGIVRIQRPKSAGFDAADKMTRITELARWAVAGPTAAEQAQGLRPVFPEGTSLQAVRSGRDGIVEFLLDVPAPFVLNPNWVESHLDAMARALWGPILDMDVPGFQILMRDPASGEFVPIEKFLPPLQEPEAPVPDTAAPVVQEKTGTQPPVMEPQNNFPVPGSSRPVGALTGKAVYLNPGHGWVYRDTGSWGLQRGFTQNNIEDFSNVDWVNSFLAAYAYNAGADVFSVREMDFNTNMVIVDNDDGNNGTTGYFETGSGWINSSLAGFRNGFIPYLSGQDPFSSGTNRLNSCVVGTPTASASWVPSMPAEGWYNVYVSHAAFTNRSPQAHYRVHHAGGTTDYYLDQRMRRFTWVFIGRYYFEAGVNPERAKVVLFNDSTTNTHFISADAVRFGGGMGLIRRGSATSGKPRTDEDSRYHAQFCGVPTATYDKSGDDESDGWAGRPQMGRWLKQQAEAYGAPAQDSVFISNHTNAFDGTARGLDTYVYTGYTGTWHDTFRNFVHDEVLNDGSVGYSSLFINHGVGKRFGNYGENNPANVSDLMPIFLGEWLFHDNATDMSLYHDPKFRMNMARAIVQGTVKFWASRNGTAVNLLPEPPRNLRVIQTTSTAIQIGWDVPLTDTQNVRGQAATGYKVYVSTHGRGFGAGIPVSGGGTTTYTLTNVQPGTTYYVYVTATNAGGESFPTETLGAKTTTAFSAPKLLIVNGFDKLDIATRVQVPWSGSTLFRQILHKMNTFDYIVEHARAIDQYSSTTRPIAFDSCNKEAVALGLVNLANYAGVIWIGGMQAEVSTTDPTNDISLSAANQTRLQNYLNAGGRLFISGSDIAWDLDRGGSTTFVDNFLKANYVSDSSGTFGVSPVPGSIFEGLAALSFDDGNGPTYRVHWPDVISTAGGSIAALSYGGGATLVDAFDAIGGWQDPNFSGQTNADAASTFDISTAQVRQGTGAGRLYYVWGTGNFIREYNSALPSFPAAGATFSLWVYGDNSGNAVQICLRDSDNELFRNTTTTINFTGWREITWNIASDWRERWAGSGDNTITGPDLRLDSIHITRGGSSPASGYLYFDDARVSLPGGSGQIAAVQFAGPYKLVYLAFPFETILSATARNNVMARVLDFFFQQPVSALKTETFDLPDITPPGSATGWSEFGFTPSGLAYPDYDSSRAAMRGYVSADATRFRVSGWMANASEWLTYNQIGHNKHVRGRFYMYRAGQSNPNALNTIPSLRMRLNKRFAVNSMLEVFSHVNADAANEAMYAELRPSADPARPSLYRVDMDVIDVPYLAANSGLEGVGRAFEAYAIDPQDNGFIAMTESVIGTYDAALVPNSAAPVQVFQTGVSDAGSLAAVNPSLEISSLLLIPGGSQGQFPAADTNPAAVKPVYSESSAGVSFDSTGVASDRIGVLSKEFFPGNDQTLYPRVEPGRQYSIRWHITSTQQANRQAQIRLRSRSARFGWSQKFEIGGAWGTGGTTINANNSIAQQSLPGIGSQNPDKIGSENGGWYTLMMHTPLSLDIRGDGTGNLAARMPILSSEPGPGVNAPSRRDIRLGCDLVDTLSGGVNAHLEQGQFTIDRVEVRSYTLVPD
ncbi:MAG: fibronectin type III domain-containing protein [Candidatus Sumerlaeaceae bacterium]|nr:fibronectin type III domain-containing protein [Candidatus Sumerlaeaceae bacterium]